MFFFFKFFLGECQMLTQTDKDLWDALVTRLAKLLDDARWTIDSYSSVKVELCESIIVCLQPLLQFAVYIGIYNYLFYVHSII